VAIVGTDISEEYVASIIRMISLIRFTLMMEAARRFSLEQHSVTSQMMAFFAIDNSCYIVANITLFSASASWPGTPPARKNIVLAAA
jgi:hypothetical protein